MSPTLDPTLTSLLNWELKKGSHEFPGPHGGTCINEAAIVAAGFEYRQVSSATDCPPCFSRVLAAYALQLNDGMPDDLRQELLTPFVTRLAGTADSREIEGRRLDYIALETCRRILPIAMRAAGLEEHAKALETAPDLKTALQRSRAAAAAAAEAAAARRQVWAISAEILDGAMQIGRRTDPLDIELVVDRMRRARAPDGALAREEA